MCLSSWSKFPFTFFGKNLLLKTVLDKYLFQIRVIIFRILYFQFYINIWHELYIDWSWILLATQFDDVKLMCCCRVNDFFLERNKLIINCLRFKLLHIPFELPCFIKCLNTISEAHVLMFQEVSGLIICSKETTSTQSSRGNISSRFSSNAKFCRIVSLVLHG